MKMDGVSNIDLDQSFYQERDFENGLTWSTDPQ